MAGATHFALYMAKLNATVVDEIVDDACSPNIDSRRMTPLGSVDPTVVMRFGSRPMFRLTSLKVATLLGAVGIGGDDLAAGAEFSYIERTQGGAFEATGKKLAATKCFAYPERISVAQDGYAAISYIAIPYSSDGATAPLAASAALVTGTPAISELYTLGAVSFNGTPISRPISWDLDFGIRVETLKAAGLQWADKVFMREPREPMVRIRAADFDEVTTARLTGELIDDVVLTLQKLSLTGAGLTGANAITLSMAKAYIKQDVEASVDGEAGVVLTCEPIKDGVTAIIAVA